MRLTGQYYGDVVLGVSVVDRFTYYLLNFLNRIDLSSNVSIADMVTSTPPS